MDSLKRNGFSIPLDPFKYQMNNIYGFLLIFLFVLLDLSNNLQ